MTLLSLLSPTTGRPLRPAGPHALTDGSERWPVVADIPYLRTGRDALRREVLGALDAGDERAALALLLADQDPFAPLPPPDRETLLDLVGGVKGGGAASLREAMRVLNFGPVADYFAVRTSTPTFLSGLALLSQCGGGRPVVEVACGVGQLLREPARRCEAVAGTDLVFSKLWLARTFVVPGAELVCGDACGPLAEPNAEVTVLCHDAFYFFADKPAAAAALQRLAGTGGRVLIGHAHNRNWNHGVAGNLLTPEGYADLFPGCAAFDDAALAAAHLSGMPAEPDHPAAFEGVEAVSLAWQRGDAIPSRAPDAYALPVEGTELVLNPLLEAVGGVLRPKWPAPRFAEEYRSAAYLCGEPVPSPEVMRCAADGNYDYAAEVGLYAPAVPAEVYRLARARVLIPLEDVI